MNLKPSKYTKNILKVFTGSGLASIISLIIHPILTRLFTPQDFGNYQLLLSFTTLFVSISGFKYEMALVLPKYNKEYKYIYLISLLNLVASTLLFAILFYAFGNYILNWLNAEQLAPYLIFCIVGIFIGGLLQIMRYVLIRNGKFKQLAINKIIESSINNTGALGFGLLSPTFIGLFISYFSAALTSSIIIFYKIPPKIHHINWKYLTIFFLKYRKFLLLNTPGVFINTFSAQLPIFYIAKFYGVETLGIYQLANKYISIPVNLAGNSISQAFLKEASNAFRESKLLNIYLDTIKKSVLVIIFPLITVLIFAPISVDIIFGEKWKGAGLFMQILIFGVFFRFISSPTSSIFSIINKQEILFFLMSTFFIIKFICLFYIGTQNVSDVTFLIIITIINSIFYIFINIFAFIHVKNGQQLHK